jgi:hypothetical protein
VIPQTGQLQPALDKLREDRAHGRPQYLVALQEANRVRIGRAALRREIADGVQSARDVIKDPPDVAVTMSVLDVLMAQHRWGRHRALRTLVVAQVREGRTVGALTPRQREVLVDLLWRAA